MTPSRLDAWIAKCENIQAPLSRAGLLDIQLDRLNEVLARERARKGFYAKRGLPERLDSRAALSALPPTTAAELAAHAPSMLLLSQSEVARVITEQTSGSTGFAKRVFYTKEDVEDTVGFFAAGLGELIFPGEAALILMPFSPSGGGLGGLIARAVESLGARPVPAGVDKSYGELEALIRETRPAACVAMPVPLLSLLRFLGGPLSLRRALVSADTLPETVERAVEKCLGSPLFPHYGARECGLGGAITCPAHAGMHLRENHIIAEIVDEAGRPLPEGERGELVITTIGLRALPLLRYKTGDMARYTSAPCVCGGVCARIYDVGRKGEAGLLSMAELDNALFGVEGLVDCRAKLVPEALELFALTRENCEAELRAAAQRLFPEREIRIERRAVQAADTALYMAKRGYL